LIIGKRKKKKLRWKKRKRKKKKEEGGWAPPWLISWFRHWLQELVEILTLPEGVISKGINYALVKLWKWRTCDLMSFCGILWLFLLLLLLVGALVNLLCCAQSIWPCTKPALLWNVS
jgi:hypothetical protein